MPANNYIYMYTKYISIAYICMYVCIYKYINNETNTRTELNSIKKSSQYQNPDQ